MTIQLPSVSQGLPLDKKQLPKNHLQTLLDGFCDFSGVEKSELVFKGLSLNSKKVLEDYLFLACAGASVTGDSAKGANDKKTAHHGIAYAGDAINRGATCIAWEPTDSLQSMPTSCVVKDRADVPLIRVELLHEKVGEIAARFYDYPSRTLNMTGITGTNGKTSTAHFIAQLLHHIELKNRDKEAAACAVIGTLGNGFYGQLEKSTHTTPDAVTLQDLLAEFRDSGAKNVVMEVSSHALAQGRVNSVEFDTAVFTNLTRDHLDYHGDMQSYAEEKLKLFQCRSLRNIVLNIDDAFAKEIMTQVESEKNAQQVQVISCSRLDSGAHYFASEVFLNKEGIIFTLTINESTSSQRYQVVSHLVGDFNIDNLLAAIAVLHQQGHAIDDILCALAEVRTVPGRMEQIMIQEESSAKESLPLIVIDYAHTPDALEKGLKALRAHTKNKLVCVFGCGGDRDKGKRPLMAEIAEKYSDRIMVTSDNPRTEAAEMIIDEIMAGFNSQQNVSYEIDRKAAIYATLESACADDVIFIAGKGHEDYQEINGERFPFSDSECVISFYTNGHKH